MSAPYRPEEVAALRQAKDWPSPMASASQLIEHGFDRARRFYSEHPELLPAPELLPDGQRVHGT